MALGSKEDFVVQAVWNGAVLAESDETIVVEGNHYFPASALKMQYFQPSPTTTTCHAKGQARYYHIEVEGKKNTDAAWFYATPKESAKRIAGYVAFWKGVKVG
jgi:uncharacterized protein (DUF427 family)